MSVGQTVRRAGTRGPLTGDRRPLAERFARAWQELTAGGARAGGGLRGRSGGLVAHAGNRIGRRSTFRGAEVSRLLADWVATAIAPDLEIRSDLRLLRARARELRRNNPYVRQYMNMLKTNVLGPVGMDLQAQVRDAHGKLIPDVNDVLETAWYRYATGPVSVDGRQDLSDFSQLALETAAGDGEAFVRLIEDADLNPFGLSLQLIDADLVDDTMTTSATASSREVRLGVEVDAYGRPQGYWITEQPGYTPGIPGVTPVRYRLPAGELLHLYRPIRPNQSRGVTWVAPVMLPLQHLNGYVEAELVAARTAAAKMGFIETKDASAAAAPADDGTGTGPDAVQLEANPGTIEELDPGQEFAAWDPTHPTTAFPDFVKAILREVATGLGVSYNALANDLEGVNYSSMRSGLLIERDLWKMLQTWWASAFLTPVYRRWLNTALLAGQLPLRERDWRRYTDVRWQGRRWPWVDPKNDLEAAAMSLELGLTSHRRLAAEVGDDHREIVEELAEELREAERAGVDIMRRGSGGMTPSNGQPMGKDGEEEDADDNGDSPTGRALARARGRLGRQPAGAGANGIQH